MYKHIHAFKKTQGDMGAQEKQEHRSNLAHIKRIYWAKDIIQLVKHLPSMPKALGLTQTLTKPGMVAPTYKCSTLGGAEVEDQTFKIILSSAVSLS